MRTKAAGLAGSAGGVIVVALALASCGRTDVAAIFAEGDQGSACYPNGTCNAGLACSNRHVCVAHGGDAGDAAADASSDAGPDASAANDAAAEAFARSYCARELACFGVPGGFLDVDTCVARTKLDMVDALGARGTGWTAASMNDCASQTKAASCTELWRGLDCLQKPGTLTDGAACDRASQCVSFACRRAPQARCGTCAPASSVGVECGDPSECAYPLRCIANKCVAVLAENVGCSPDTDLCAYGLGCQNNKCVPAGEGVPCSYVAQDCQTNFFCSFTTNACVRDSFAQPSETCGWINGDLTQWVDCLGSLRGCVRDNQQFRGACPKLLADGAPCGEPLTACVPPAVCTGGVCAVPRADACK